MPMILHHQSLKTWSLDILILINRIHHKILVFAVKFTIQSDVLPTKWYLLDTVLSALLEDKSVYQIVCVYRFVFGFETAAFWKDFYVWLYIYGILLLS